MVTSPDGVHWAPLDDPSFKGNASFLGFSNGRFLAIASGGQVFVSTDGRSWEGKGMHPAVLPATFGGIRDFVFGDRVYLTVGRGVWTSPDGVSWTPVPEFAGRAINSAAFGVVSSQHAFLISGAQGKIWMSLDRGRTWTLSRAGRGNDQIDDLLYERGSFVAVGATRFTNSVLGATSAGLISVLGDGQSWVDSHTREGLRSVAAGFGLLVAVGERGTMLSSASGWEWSSRNRATADTLRDVAFGNGTYVAVGDRVVTSPDGVTWTERFPATRLNSIAYGRGLFVAVGPGGIFASTNGLSWKLPNVESRVSTTGGPLNSVAFGNECFVAVGSEGQGYPPMAYVSKNGRPFERVSLPPMAGELRAVTFGDGKFVAVGHVSSSSGTPITALVSNDGETWIPFTALTTGTWRGIAHGAGLFVAVGEGHQMKPLVMTSRDGIVWAEQSIPAVGRLNKIAFSGGYFVVVGNGTILVSPDGQEWTAVRAPEGELLGIGYGQGSFTAVGAAGLIVESPAIRGAPNLRIAREPSSGFMRLIVDIPSSGGATIETSEDFQSWTPIPLVAPTETEPMTDAAAIGAEKRFYRAVIRE